MSVPICGINKDGNVEPFKVKNGKLLLELQLNRIVTVVLCLLPFELAVVIYLLNEIVRSL